ncbi:hypothetical protein JF66_02405 [Cryobacterium sp. MLB-32]|uniref:GNAT family acetyltransferase n=1 Tax=Cryobacterium sp. MLB-32 TaxID=1529318 RepID=UPI0004E6C636|nr:hypothetical protein JF66_02405 [Cryobacterium sp. MLB-32]
MIIRAFRRADTEAVVQLWHDCGLTRPQNNPRLDIERKLTVQPELFLVGTVDGALMGSIMAGYDGHRGWVNYLAVSPGHQGAGSGQRLMREVERMLTERGCPKVNLQIRAGNDQAISFYRRLGYAPDQAVSFGKRIIPD